MIDLVERLRKQAWQRSGAPKMDAGHAKMLEWQAADEIERLRDEIHEYKKALENGIREASEQDSDIACLKADIGTERAARYKAEREAERLRYQLEKANSAASQAMAAVTHGETD